MIKSSKSKYNIRYLRFYLGRAVIHIGIKVLPEGPVRSELYRLIDEWATEVYKKITTT